MDIDHRLEAVMIEAPVPVQMLNLCSWMLISSIELLGEDTNISLLEDPHRASLDPSSLWSFTNLLVTSAIVSSMVVNDANS